ncbi:GTP-binding protein [Paenibacillus sp. NEAU-GSW1]|uniref:CobW family GTP-binding protein n=1 Tax=Paenibacillus sp. NEAU-GSW1 TaxID=2682486 RepID=UPI0012E224E7|nr:GTP-binding protein [Paenibacillus sp. NEAU-GSW1]MUT67814.1 GTP-binding protein [Paenibacillus sp. NEAU-GSW1]
MDNTKALIPVHLLSGFLGSGKTTLLTALLEHCRNDGLKAAVIMNELGDINLDGQLVDGDVPMSEMLSGCICCTIRGDLSMEIKALMDEHQPDIIFIESTGAANPIEILDGVTEAAMYCRIELLSVITVVDGPELLQRRRSGKGRTYKLMQEQIRCATRLLLNKADKLEPDELVEAQQLLRDLNEHAPIMATIRCAVDDWNWLLANQKPYEASPQHADHSADCGCGHQHDHGDHHHMHEHVMALTHYLRGPVDSEAFEALLKRLPDNIYRAKGIVTFSDTASRFLFQYAYRESDFMRITPQGEVNDVAVFIGEHFSKDGLLAELNRLESGGDNC